MAPEAATNGEAAKPRGISRGQYDLPEAVRGVWDDIKKEGGAEGVFISWEGDIYVRGGWRRGGDNRNGDI